MPLGPFRASGRCRNSENRDFCAHFPSLSMSPNMPTCPGHIGVKELFSKYWQEGSASSKGRAKSCYLLCSNTLQLVESLQIHNLRWRRIGCHFLCVFESMCIWVCVFLAHFHYMCLCLWVSVFVCLRVLQSEAKTLSKSVFESVKLPLRVLNLLLDRSWDPSATNNWWSWFACRAQTWSAD